ncbi:MAG: MerC domain-containing protein [Armatimonadetes bacterium]|nr:MerC domain-containing protein [Armatimonadota bacterium]
MKQLLSKIDVDKAGALAGTLCAVHCLLTGLFLSMVSVVGLGWLGSKTSEAIFIGTAVILGSWAVRHGIRKHHSYVPSIFFVLGLTFIAISHFVFGHEHASGVHEWDLHSVGSTAASVLGGLCLVTFHLLNQRMAHRCGCDCQASVGDKE